jgi:hypothetical protein
MLTFQSIDIISYLTFQHIASLHISLRLILIPLFNLCPGIQSDIFSFKDLLISTNQQILHDSFFVSRNRTSEYIEILLRVLQNALKSKQKLFRSFGSIFTSRHNIALKSQTDQGSAMPWLRVCCRNWMGRTRSFTTLLSALCSVARRLTDHI